MKCMKSMTRATLMTSVLVVALTAALGADIFIYELQGDGSAKRVGRVTDGGPDSATVCVLGGCSIGIRCSSCHTQAVDERKLAGDREGRHLSKHFPANALALREGQKANLGTGIVTRVNGQLVLQDSKGRKVTFPPDALLVKGRDGQPIFISYKGSMPPPMLR